MHLSHQFRRISNYLKFLPAILIFLTTIIISWIYIESTEKLFDKNAKENIENLYNKEKDTLKQNVQIVINLIKYKKEHIKEQTKQEITQRTQTAFEIATNIYETNKKRNISINETKKEIINTLRNLKYKDPKTNTLHYYYIQELHNENEIIAKLLPASPTKEGTNRAFVKDINGFEYIKHSYQIATTKKEGFLQYYWYKLKNNKKNAYPKLSYIKLFEPFNWIIGYGEYIDDMEEKIKDETMQMVSQLKYIDNNYIFMYELLDINGGKQFAKMLINPNKPSLIGNYISSEVIDANGKKYREIFLQDIKKDGESFVEYIYPKLDTNNSINKLSYFYLESDWNWIIAQGVYLDEVYKKIEQFKKEKEKEKQLLIFKSIILAIILAIIASIITYFALNIIKNMIIELKNKEIQNYKLISQQSKKASMGEMLENIAHQWKQPLTFITTVATSAKVKSELGLLNKQEAVLEDFETISTHAKYMAQTIDDFKNYFKEEKAKSYFKISYLIDTTLIISKSMIKKYDIDVIIEIENDIEYYGYKNELIQVIMNILSNAKDAMKENNIEDKKIKITQRIDKDYVVLSIEDNAGGIPEKIINQIFDQYFTTKGENGTGIGLYMTKKIITDSFDGHIKVQNKNDGAIFTIKLPIKKAIIE